LHYYKRVLNKRFIRFDREIAVDVPDEKARQRILQFHTLQMPLGNDVNIGKNQINTITL
jgi:SpoVK/Ycf46/Vps4 family AAA+-type ATPase